MANNTTKLANLINPEVMGQMISAGLPKAIRFTGLAKVDTTLQGVAGNTITVPYYKYIGDAEDVAEGGTINTALLKTDTKKATVKKVGKGIDITDEAILSGYGDPVAEAVAQLRMSIASKIDDDIVAALQTSTLVVDNGTKVINYEGVVDALDKYEEEDDTRKVIFIHPKHITL